MSKSEISLQLKRNKQTFIITTKSLKVGDIRKQLHAVITDIGGLSNSSGEAEDEDDIPIPVPSFSTNSDDESDNEAQINDLKPSKNKTVPKLTDLVLGIPKDPSDPYNSRFRDLQDDNEKLGEIREFGILAFRLTEENFEVVQPVQDDE